MPHSLWVPAPVRRLRAAVCVPPSMRLLGQCKGCMRQTRKGFTPLHFEHRRESLHPCLKGAVPLPRRWAELWAELQAAETHQWRGALGLQGGLAQPWSPDMERRWPPSARGYTLPSGADWGRRWQHTGHGWLHTQGLDPAHDQDPGQR